MMNLDFRFDRCGLTCPGPSHRLLGAASGAVVDIIRREDDPPLERVKRDVALTAHTLVAVGMTDCVTKSVPKDSKAASAPWYRRL